MVNRRPPTIGDTPMTPIAALALLIAPSLVQTLRIEFEAYPGPDGLLGTGDDVAIVAPSTFNAQPLQLTDEFAALGIRFIPNPPTNDANEVLNSSSFVTTAPHTPPNLFASSGSAVIRASFTVPVSRVAALIGISAGSDELEIFDAAGASLGAIIGDNAVVSLSAAVPIASFEIRPIASTSPAIDNLEFDTVASGPTIYCTAGTTTNGCVPSISGTGTPSASAPSGFTIDVTAVEGQKQGLVFYGLDNTGFTPSPWGQGTSLLCVKPPTQRTTNLSSGGTISMCDGLLSLDWNAYRAANPGALGQPFAAGQQVFAQAWFRDPPSPKTTNLSDALQFTLAP